MHADDSPPSAIFTALLCGHYTDLPGEAWCWQCEFAWLETREAERVAWEHETGDAA